MTLRALGRPVTTASTLLLLAALLAAVSACGRRQAAETAPAGDAPAAVPVETLTLAPDVFQRVVTLSGSTEALREVDISAKLAGSVERFDHELGDALADGELILSLDLRPFRAAVTQAEAGLLAARAAADKAAKEYERSRELKARDRISDAEMELAELAKLQSESARLGAEAALTMAKLQLEDAEIRAPFAGRLAFKGVDAHEQIAPGMPVAAVADLSRIVVRGSVAEREAVRLAVDMPARVTVPSLDDETFAGRVRAVGVRANPATRSYDVEILVENPERRLLSGMAARAEIVVDRQPNAMLIPGTAVVEQYGEPVAFVVEDGVARRRGLSLGAASGDRVLVTQGLAAGDRLIVKGQWSVRDGLAVAVTEPTP